MLLRALWALGVLVITVIVCLLLGALLLTINQETIQSIGNFLKQYAGLIGILAALLYFFFGYRPAPRV